MEPKNQQASEQQPLTYELCLNQMFHWNLQRRASSNYKQKESLEVMKKLMDLFENPQNSFKSILVAGTNGKGSVTKKTAVALQTAGFKTGMYISPHISCFRERISINQELITEEEVVSYYKMILKKIEQHPELFPGNHQTTSEHQVKVTFFELTTLMAFLKFKEAGVDIAVLECGLGGRLDATNIVSPIACAIATIGWDHMEALGDTLEKIAREKAGIMREGVPVVIGRDTVQDVLEEEAKKKGAKLIIAKKDDGEKLKWQFIQDNNDVARCVLNEIGNSIGREFAKEVYDSIEVTAQPCRFQKVSLENVVAAYQSLQPKAESLQKQEVYLDVCHNLSSFEAVVALLQSKYPGRNLRCVCAFSKTKEIKTILDYMIKNIQKIHFIQLQHFKLGAIKDLFATAIAVEQQVGAEKRVQPVIANGEVKATLEQVLLEIEPEEVLLLCGSFYIMDDLREFLLIEVPRDPKSPNQS